MDENVQAGGRPLTELTQDMPVVGASPMADVDTLATIAEPAAVLTLATCVGVVVFSAVLPIVRLQEVL